MNQDAKTAYAQSSDIKSRTYLEYRRDMKKKAIAELEIIEWLQSKMQDFYKTRSVKLKKSGGDAFLWFLRKGGVSREPDYEAQISDTIIKVEFQYADKPDLPFYDFTLSKISKKSGKTRETHQDRLLVYISKPLLKYAIFKPDWVVKNGKIAEVPAWRKDAYRVPKNKFNEILKEDESLKDLCKSINNKNTFLEFQHQLIDLTRDELSYLLQGVVDEKKIVQMIPDNLDNFFQVCFILDNLNRVPKNANIWLIYLLSFLNEKTTTRGIYQICYCADFLYSKIDLKSNELETFINKIKEMKLLVKKHEKADGTFQSSISLAPLDEIRYALFAVNILEDLTQDIIFYYKTNKLEPICKIYQTIRYPDKVVGQINKI